MLLVACKTSVTEGTYKVNPDEVSKTLKYLSSDELEGRNTGSEGIAKAAMYLQNQLKAYHIKPYYQTYYDTLTTINLPAYNVIGFMEGTDQDLKKEWVVLGAHYDHIGISTDQDPSDQIYNGANDNASGTTVLSEIAKALSKEKKLKRSVMIVYFSAEETGLNGSYHLARQLKEKGVNVYTMLNFEMVGVPMKHPFDLFLTGYDYSNMGEKLNAYAKHPFIGRSEKAEQNHLFQYSDNYPFYLTYNIPSHTVSAFDFTNFDYYHHVKDEFEEMNIPFMVSVTEKMIPVVIEMINAPSQDIKLKK